tara:strand:- start:2294 stop:3190 length:897 start_codon:yes stop_codon:yes gene_type:complete
MHHPHPHHPAHATDASRQRISFVLSDVQQRHEPVQYAPPPPPQQLTTVTAAAATTVQQRHPLPPTHHHHHQPHAQHPTQHPAHHQQHPIEIDAAMETGYHPLSQPPQPPPAYPGRQPPPPACAVPPPRPPPPPAALPRRSGCACSLLCLAATGCLVFGAVLLVEVPLITGMDSPLTRSRRAGMPRGLVDKPVPGKAVHFGLWDSRDRLSPLQLTVVVSMALQLEDWRVHVAEEPGKPRFFHVEVDDESDALAEAVNAPSFAESLNAQALSSAAEIVVSQSAVVVTSVANRTRVTGRGG